MPDADVISLADHADCPHCAAWVKPTIQGACPRCGLLLDAAVSAQRDTVISNRPADWSALSADPETDHDDTLVGELIDDYRVESLLGRGGMGRVYLARHELLHRPCALKILSPRRASQDQDYVQRFLDEGRLTAALVHPNIVTIHASGQNRGLNFLEMEFVAGGSLWQLIHDSGRLSHVRAVSLAARLADALAAAHRKGIVHRDFKPDNVLLTLQGIPKLADFGLCKRLDTSGLDASGINAVPEGLCGTPSYMAPELFQGRPATPASDVYALGVTLYLMLTGRHPFSADTLQGLIAQVTTESPPRLLDLVPDIPLEVAECVGLMLDKTPANRFQDGLQAAQHLYAVIGQMRDVGSLLHEAFQHDPGVSWTNDLDLYRLVIKFADGRRQVVFIEPSAHAAAERLLLIYSTCCTAQSAYYEAALRFNAEMPHGSIGLRDVDGGTQFVVQDTYPRSTVDAEEIRRSVLEVARRADTIEKLLTGIDLN